MTRLNLNLARRPFTNDTLIWLATGMLTAFGLGLTSWNLALFLSSGSHVAVLSEQRTALESELRGLVKEEQDLTKRIRTARTELLAARASRANAIIQAWAFSWTRLFNDLETVMPMGARLIAIRPSVDEGLWVDLDGIARDVPAFWELQENLLASPFFGYVYPEVAQPTSGGAALGSGEILFTLQMEYFPAVSRQTETAARTLDESSRAEGTQAAPPVTPPSEAAEEAGAAGEETTPGPAPAEAATTATGQGPGAPADASAEGAQAGGGAEGAASASGAAAQEAVGRGRRKKAKQPPVRVGVERAQPLPLGAPGMVTPDVTNVPRPDFSALEGLSEEELEAQEREFEPGKGPAPPGGIRPMSAEERARLEEEKRKAEEAEKAKKDSGGGSGGGEEEK